MVDIKLVNSCDFLSPNHFFSHSLSLTHTHHLCSNEREGIPVPIIHLLDSCVEIPQFGVIRSLNAHVSGALFVWEYVKQHSVKKEPLRTM